MWWFVIIYKFTSESSSTREFFSISFSGPFSCQQFQFASASPSSAISRLYCHWCLAHCRSLPQSSSPEVLICFVVEASPAFPSPANAVERVRLRHLLAQALWGTLWWIRRSYASADSHRPDKAHIKNLSCLKKYSNSPYICVVCRFRRQDVAALTKSHSRYLPATCRDSLTKRQKIQRRSVVSQRKSSRWKLTKQMTTALDGSQPSSDHRPSSDCFAS